MFCNSLSWTSWCGIRSVSCCQGGSEEFSPVALPLRAASGLFLLTSILVVGALLLHCVIQDVKI
eukprot:5409895-Amphidinium_carterae.2